MDALTKRVSEQVREEYDFYEHMSPSARHREIIPDEVVDQFAIAGTADDCLKRCRELFDCGFDEITVRPYALGDLSRADMMQRFAVEVMEPFRRLYG
jgi:5,10-methylenetetrahydromethanopterin reductase